MEHSSPQNDYGRWRTFILIKSSYYQLLLRLNDIDLITVVSNHSIEGKASTVPIPQGLRWFCIIILYTHDKEVGFLNIQETNISLTKKYIFTLLPTPSAFLIPH